MMAPTLQRSPLAADLDHILSHTQEWWEELRGGAVFITGGTGFFGRWLLESFVEANHRFALGARAVVLTRQPDKFRRVAERLATDEAVKLVQGDILMLDAGAVRKQLGASAPDEYSHVIHAAAETGEAINRVNPAQVLENIFAGTRRALDFAAQTGARSFLLASSGAVYGEQPSEVSHIAENHPGAPEVSSRTAAYGTGKRVAELLCHAEGRRTGINCKIARCFAFVGPHLALDAHYAIGNFIRDALAGKPIQVKGDGTPFRSYLYAADLAIWLWTLLLNPGATGTYNVGSDDARSIREIAECVARNSPLPLPVSVALKADTSRPTLRYVPDIQKAQRDLGLTVWTPLDSAIQKTIAFHQATKDLS